MVEYAVLLGLIAVLSIAMAFAVGWDIRRLFAGTQESMGGVASQVAHNPGNPGAIPPEDGEDEDNEGALLLRVEVEPGDQVYFVMAHDPITGEPPNATIDWGDGASADCPTTVTAYSNLSCLYEKGGSYQVAMRGKIPWLMRLPISGRVRAVESWGSGNGLTSLELALASPEGPITVPSTLPSSVTNLGSLFSNWGDIPVPSNVASWDVSNVRTFTRMFEHTSSLPDITSWDTRSATSLSEMFRGNATFNQDISGWDVGGVQNFSGMFQDATAFNAPIGVWDTRSAENMRGVFWGATSFDQPIEGWDVSKVWGMDRMFRNASAFHQPLGSWNVGSLMGVTEMFMGAQSLAFDIGTWRPSAFQNARALEGFLASSGIRGDMRCFNVEAIPEAPPNFADEGYALIPGNHEPLWGQSPPATCSP